VGILLALVSATCYGLSDYIGGLLARRAPFLTVALAGQLGGLVLTLVAAPLTAGPAVTGADLGWGALSGVGTGLGMMFLFRGLSHGTMSVVVPVSAVGGVALPVVVGVALWGDRPSALIWAGIAVAVPALWFVSRSSGGGEVGSPAAVLDGLLASVGIALQYLALARAHAEAGLWPVTAGRVTAVGVILIAAWCGTGEPLRSRLSWRRVLGGAGAGAGAAVALTCYLLATHRELVVVAVVLSSLYPLIPVLLGVTILREPLSPARGVGLVAALVATVLIALG